MSPHPQPLWQVLTTAFVEIAALACFAIAVAIWFHPTFVWALRGAL